MFVSQCQLEQKILLTFDWGPSLKKTPCSSHLYLIKKRGSTANLNINYTMGGLIYVCWPLLRGKCAKSPPKKNHDRKCFIAWCELAGKIAEFSIVNQRTGASSSAHYSITQPVGLYKLWKQMFWLSLLMVINEMFVLQKSEIWSFDHKVQIL